MIALEVPWRSSLHAAAGQANTHSVAAHRSDDEKVEARGAVGQGGEEVESDEYEYVVPVVVEVVEAWKYSQGDPESNEMWASDGLDEHTLLLPSILQPWVLAP